MNDLYLQFDIMCIIVSLMIILPIIIKPLRINISKSLIITISIILMSLGIASIVYQHNVMHDKITLEKHYRRYIYFGNTMLCSGACCMMYIFLLG